MSLSDNPKPFLLCVAGGTASGKTTFVRLAAKILPPESVAIVTVDAYYPDHSKISFAERTKVNYDHPDSIEADLLLKHLKSLIAGAAIEMPVYDFAQHTRSLTETIKIQARPLILIDGILALHWPELRELYDYSIFIETNDRLRLKRRVERDVRERGRTEESVLSWWQERVYPMHLKYCEPTKQFANKVVSGNTEITQQLVQEILKTLKF